MCKKLFPCVERNGRMFRLVTKIVNTQWFNVILYIWLTFTPLKWCQISVSGGVNCRSQVNTDYRWEWILADMTDDRSLADYRSISSSEFKGSDSQPRDVWSNCILTCSNILQAVIHSTCLGNVLYVWKRACEMYFFFNNVQVRPLYYGSRIAHTHAHQVYTHYINNCVWG